MALLFVLQLVSLFARHGLFTVLFPLVKDECLTDFISLLTVEDDLAFALNSLSLFVTVSLTSADFVNTQA